MARYGTKATFALFDQSSGEALILSPKVPGGQTFESEQPLENIAATLAKVASLMTDQAQGTAIAELKTR